MAIGVVREASGVTGGAAGEVTGGVTGVAAGGTVALFKASFNAFPALNLGTFTAAILIFSVGFCGFTPIRAALIFARNVPKPVRVISPPAFSVVVTDSKNDSRIVSTSFFGRLVLTEIVSMSSGLFIESNSKVKIYN